ncbi:hypothetical protein F5Y11DRAFT_351458 [Daldinia sp. FL1419]|nr:hypothetical protein F5Y11DRAFT_351458 [Daldinia sp. FL1419]
MATVNRELWQKTELIRDAPWYETEDAFGVRLRDIEPRCRVADIVDDQADTLDGAVAGFKAIFAVGMVFLVPGAIVFFLAPYMIFELYRGEFWSTQATFIGIEYVPDNLGRVERNLFGLNQGHLKWSVAGSTLSQHKLSAYDDCEALPPKESISRLNPVIGSKKSYANREERPFALIDTYTRTATVFYTVRPPTALIIGRHIFARGRGASKDDCSRLERMFRVDRFRFALNRKKWEKDPELLHSKSKTSSSGMQ